MIDDAREVVLMLQQGGADLVVEQEIAGILRLPGKPLKKMDADVLAVIGSDKFLLTTLLKIGKSDIPLLPVSSKGQPDFLFDVTASGFESVVADLLSKQWTVDRRLRLVADISGQETPPLLNDIAVFAKRSATLIRYSLLLDNEEFLKDGSDGLIVATPTGSTAYSMSVGGPVIVNPARVFSIVPVNSVNPAQRHFIVSDETEITIRDLTSTVAIEAVLDGQIRRSIDNQPVTIRKSDSDAIFVKFAEERIAALRGKLLEKTELFESLAQGLPPSAKLVLKALEYKGQLTQREITDETMLPSRTVRYALSMLMSEGLVSKKVSLRDSRQGLYSVNKKAQEESTSA
jgi:NAD+ kinase